ncbi:MAG: SDR family NAD(P)-dependent oxidoreductase [Anaerolineae bacterium]|nr:SDR family NAD(P)-dependent oxidoreductase [Anaerolineae bacterium]
MRIVWLLISAALGWWALRPAARQPVVTLRGRTVIISGEDSAIRRAIAAAFAARGARVFVAEPDAPPEQVVRDALARFRRLDALVNIAGRGPGGLAVDVDAAALRAAAEVGLFRAARLTQESLPVLLRQGRGHIVNVGSVAGNFPTPALAVASGLGAGMAAFTDALRREVDDRGVRVSLVLAGEGGAPGALADPAPEAAARAAVDAVRYGRRTVVAGGGAMGARAAAAQWLERLAPGLADLYWRWMLTPEVIARLDDRLTG